MKLDEFIRNPNAHVHANVEPVTFKVIGRDSSGSKFLTEARAVLTYVSEDDRAEALREARREMRKHYPDGNVPDAELSNEETYQVLHRALRDEDDPRASFAESASKLRQAIAQAVATELYRSFLIFLSREFPPVVGEEQFKALVEDAKKKYLPDLLSQYGFSTLARALPSLAAHFSESPTQT